MTFDQANSMMIDYIRRDNDAFDIEEFETMYENIVARLEELMRDEELEAWQTNWMRMLVNRWD